MQEEKEGGMKTRGQEANEASRLLTPHINEVIHHGVCWVAIPPVRCPPQLCDS